MGCNMLHKTPYNFRAPNTREYDSATRTRDEYQGIRKDFALAEYPGLF